MAVFRLSKERAILESTLHELMAGDPRKKKFATIGVGREMSKLSVAWNRLVDSISLHLDEIEVATLRLELKKFEWENKFALETGVEKKLRPPNIFYDSTAYVNLTEVDIPHDIELALAWGPRFVFPNNQFDMFDFIPDLEAIIENKLPDLLQDQARKLSSIQMSKFGKSEHVNTMDTWLNFLGQRSTDFFKYHSDLIVLNSDKGKHTVVMLRSSYDQKIAALLADSSTYKIVNSSWEKTSREMKCL